MAVCTLDCFWACLFSPKSSISVAECETGSLSENGIDQETEIGAVHISLTTIEEIVLRAAKQVKGVFNLKARVHYDEEKSNLSIGIKIEIDGKRSDPVGFRRIAENRQRSGGSNCWCRSGSGLYLCITNQKSESKSSTSELGGDAASIKKDLQQIKGK